MKNNTKGQLFCCVMIIRFLVIILFIMSCGSSDDGAGDIVDNGNTGDIYSCKVEVSFYSNCYAEDPAIDCTGEITWHFGWADGSVFGNTFKGYLERSEYTEEIAVIFNGDRDLIRVEIEANEGEGLIGRTVSRGAIFLNIPLTDMSTSEMVFSVSGKQAFDHIGIMMMNITWVEQNLNAHLKNWECNENSYIKVTCDISQ